MNDTEALKEVILLLFDLLSPEEQDSFAEEVRTMLITNSRKAEYQWKTD